MAEEEEVVEEAEVNIIRISTAGEEEEDAEEEEDLVTMAKHQNPEAAVNQVVDHFKI
jgi:hypothetical protein